MEIKTKAEEDANAKAELAAEAEEEAKAKAESAAKAEEEAKVKIEEETNARVESATKAEEEAKAKAESAAKAEEEAKAKAESATRAEEEAIAKLETDVEEKIKVKAEEEANTKAKAAAKAEEEAKARAEAAVKAEEEAKAKAEAAAKAEKDNEARIIAASEDYAKAIALAMAEAEVEKDSSKNNEDKKETTSETESLPNLDLSTFKSNDTNEATEDNAEISERTSKIEEGEQEVISAKDGTIIIENEVWPEEENEIQITTTPSIRRRRKPINLALVLPLLFAAFICVTLLLPYVLPTKQYISTIEKFATDSISEPVKVGSLHVTFLPVPSIEASAIEIGSNIKIRSAILIFSIFSSFNSDDLKEIELEGISVLPGAYDSIAKWGRSSNAPQLSKLKKINLKETKLELENISIPLLNGSINLRNNNKFTEASFASSDKEIKINILPSQSDFQLNISAKKWKPFLSSSIVLSDLDAKVIMNSSLIQATEIDSRIYDGILKGTAFAKWEDNWNLNGEFEIERVNIKEAAISNNTDIPMEGKLFSKVKIFSDAQELDQLYDAMRINGSFQLQNGLVKIDLGNSIRTTSKGSIAGGQTKFDELSGIIEIDGESYQFNQLKLSSGILSAEGALDITADKKLTGEVKSSLKGGHTMSSGPIALEGTIKNPVLVRN